MEYHLSHAMILEGPDPEANLALAKRLAQQAVCTAGAAAIRISPFTAAKGEAVPFTWRRFGRSGTLPR